MLDAVAVGGIVQQVAIEQPDARLHVARRVDVGCQRVKGHLFIAQGLVNRTQPQVLGHRSPYRYHGRHGQQYKSLFHLVISVYSFRKDKQKLTSHKKIPHLAAIMGAG